MVDAPSATPLSGLVEIDEERSLSIPDQRRSLPPEGKDAATTVKMLIVGAHANSGTVNIPGRLRLAEISGSWRRRRAIRTLLKGIVKPPPIPTSIAKTGRLRRGYAAVPADRHNVGMSSRRRPPLTSSCACRSTKSSPTWQRTGARRRSTTVLRRRVDAAGAISDEFDLSLVNRRKDPPLLLSARSSRATPPMQNRLTLQHVDRTGAMCISGRWGNRLGAIMHFQPAPVESSRLDSIG